MSCSFLRNVTDNNTQNGKWVDKKIKFMGRHTFKKFWFASFTWSWSYMPIGGLPRIILKTFREYIMMTSSNGSIFRVTGPLCGEFTVTGEFPAQRPVTRNFDVFFDPRLNKRLSKHSWGWWFEMPSGSLWRHCNEEQIRTWVVNIIVSAPLDRHLTVCSCKSVSYFSCT